MVTFPLPKVSTMVEGRVVLLGVTYINIQSRGGERENDETVKPTSLLCLCLSLTPAHCGWSAQHSSCPSPSISPMTGLNTISCVATSPTPTPVKVSTIRQVVERVGGCSSSPQQVTYRKSRQKQQMLDPVGQWDTGCSPGTGGLNLHFLLKHKEILLRDVSFPRVHLGGGGCGDGVCAKPGQGSWVQGQPQGDGAAPPYRPGILGPL